MLASHESFKYNVSVLGTYFECEGIPCEGIGDRGNVRSSKKSEHIDQKESHVHVQRPAGGGWGGGGGTPHMKGAGMLVGNFELNL